MESAIPTSRMHARQRASTEVSLLAFAVIAVMFASALDVFNVLDRSTSILGEANPLRYLILVIPLCTALWIRARRPSPLIRRPGWGEWFWFLMWAYGLAGTIFGSTFLGTATTARPVFLPMSVGLLFLLATEPPTTAQSASLLRAIALATTIYVVMNFLVNTEILPGLAEYRQYRNASFAFVCGAIAYAFVMRRHLRLVVLVVLTAGIFVTYPSATSILMLGSTSITLFVTSPRATGLRTALVGVSLLFVGTVAVLNLDAGVEITSEYFDTVQKENANQGRLDLWGQGLAQFAESPLWGQAWTEDVVVVRERDQVEVPYHNDFILFLAEGGLVALGLLVGWIAWLEWTMLRRYRAFVSHGRIEQATLLRVILVVLNGFFTAMVFNPVLPGLTRSITVFGLAGLASSLGVPDDTPPARPRTTVASSRLEEPST